MNLTKPLPHEEDEAKEPEGESLEELRDNEYEENLNEYGDGDEDSSWPTGGKNEEEEEV